MQRSISDHEISIIKTMLLRGMKNKEIQFYFNRPERPVNSGRISNIRSGKYGHCATIECASDQIVDEFIRSYSYEKTENYTRKFGYDEIKPLSDSVLLAMFFVEPSGVPKFRLGETDCHECKESFGFKYADKWLRAVAALANNQGGYIFFGVKDKSNDNKLGEDYEVVGLDSSEFEKLDPSNFSLRIKNLFDPTPRVEIRTINIFGKSVGVIYVHSQPGRPVIATKGEGSIREGDIFFRYIGQSARIKYSDLRAMIDERDRHARAQMMPLLNDLLRLGPKNVMIADLSAGELRGVSENINISEDLLNKIKFIREGEFREVGGAPTLRLVGDVHTIGSTEIKIQKEFVTQNELLDVFLEMKNPYDARDYIRCAIEGGGVTWLPIYYFASKAEMSLSDLISFIDKCTAPAKRKNFYKNRAYGKESAYRVASGGAMPFLMDLEKGILPNVSDIKKASFCASAIMGLRDGYGVNIEFILQVLRNIKSIISNEGKSSNYSLVRRSISRIDEIYFKPKL